MKRYIVKDNNGEPSGIPFRSIEDAMCHRAVFGLPDWKIEIIDIKLNKKSTDRQKNAVRFCEKWLKVAFSGDINDFYDCSDFLSEWLVSAKMQAIELSCEYQIDAF